ncbi:Serine/threonine-protein kinase nekl-2 [Diplonema papillatum]|nr:Serine/threonine-protein kinase nekl-2 [Diplonema papillatum]
MQVADSGAPAAWSRYSKTRILGTGSFGRVYLVRRVGAGADDGEELVVKRTAIQGLGAQLLEANANEVYVLTVLSHPNVIRYIDHFVDDESYLNLVTEYCSGGDLQQLIEKRRGEVSRFTEPETAYILFQLLLGVQYLHSSQVMHRDLKPGNVFLCEDLCVKIGDFGISKMLSSQSMATTMVGTPFYLSPEVCNNEPYTHPADMWSVGCILYELLTLQRPFVGPNILAVAHAINSCVYPPLERTRFADVVASLLQSSPSKRLTAAQVLHKYFAFSDPLTPVVAQRLHDNLCRQKEALGAR